MREKNIQEEICQFGKFGLIQKLSTKFTSQQTSTFAGIAEDASVVKDGKKYSLFSSKLFVEKIHFDLTYFPLKHLGYKCVGVTLSDILGMNVIPTQIRVNIGISNRFSLAAVEEFMSGIELCCRYYHVELAGLDITSSASGLTISMTAFGETTDKPGVVKRDSAKEKELICVSGDLGAAYAGLILLEREKRVFEANPNEQPDLAGYDYLLEKQLKPEPRFDIVQTLEKEKILPTSMITVNEGLASALIQLCTQSKVGCTIYENKLPIDILTFNTLKELKIVATTVALNGGEDYELLFTIKQEDYEKIQKIETVSVIGYIHEESAGKNLITNDECLVELKAQGFGENQ